MASQVHAPDHDPETRSLTDSVMDFPTMWGRSYHKYKEGSYMLPNDETERDRLVLQYEAIKVLRNNLICYAPLKDPRHILDVGTGVGIWAVEMASLFPDARITGTDLSPIQPSMVPPNVVFEVQDCTDADWCRKPSSYDMIHSSMMVGALSSHSRLMQTARRYLKPGRGWFECHEIEVDIFSDDGTIPPNWPFTNYFKGFREGYSKFRSPSTLNVADKLVRMMQDAGYCDIQHRIDKIPLNPWPKAPFLKEVGQMWEMNWTEGLSGFSNKTYGPEGLGWTQNELEVFLIDVRKAIRDRTVHAYQKYHAVWGRRPTEDEERLMRLNAKMGNVKKTSNEQSKNGEAPSNVKTNMGSPPSPVRKKPAV